MNIIRILIFDESLANKVESKKRNVTWAEILSVIQSRKDKKNKPLQEP